MPINNIQGFVLFSYTPISDPDVKGYFDLLIKVAVYFAFIFGNLCLIICMKTSQVYPEGKMSQHFASLKPGDVVEVKG